jgi:hypothetical protein
MKRPVWLRIVLQPVLALVLGDFVCPYVALALAYVPVHLPIVAVRAGVTKAGVLAITVVESAVPYLLMGALAAAVSWLIVRKPWDALAAAALMAASRVIMNATVTVSSDPVIQWWMSVHAAADACAVFVGCIVVAWLIQRLASAPRAGVEPEGQDE